ncbi:MAG: hypothetical protein KF764_28075 [Labilithrix sp.]|nr:hypothetical protein [Labilithrix sp.]
MRVRRWLSLASAASWALVVACSGKTLDLGTARGAQGGRELDDEVDASAADLGAGSLSTRLYVDDVPCVLTREGRPQGPGAWRLQLDGTCGAIGAVLILVESDSEILYPQSCGIATSIYSWLDSDGDAGVVAYEAGFSHGSCSIASGPSATTPDAGVAFTATVVDGRGGRSRRLSYRAEGAP